MTTTPTHTDTVAAMDPVDELDPPRTASDDPDMPTTGLLATVHRDETGAQAMEYAALAGGGATIVGILIALLESERVQDRLAEFVTGLFDTLAGSLGGLL